MNLPLSNRSLTYAFSSTLRSRVRCAIFNAGVCGWYAPPANLYPHFRHSQIPVPLRCKASTSHFGQRCKAREIFSISATLFRTNLPYLQPKRPALPVTFPFAVLSELAMIRTWWWLLFPHQYVFSHLSLQLIYLIEDFHLTLAF